MTERIFHKLGSHCAPHGRGETSPEQMMQISKTLGQRFKVLHRDGLGEGKIHWTALMQKLLQSGHPVLVSGETSELQAHRYVVVTRIRRSFKYYSFCDEQTDVCTPWTLREESNLYVHEEDNPGKWESNEINFFATITGNWKHSWKKHLAPIMLQLVALEWIVFSIEIVVILDEVPFRTAVNCEHTQRW